MLCKFYMYKATKNFNKLIKIISFLTVTFLIFIKISSMPRWFLPLIILTVLVILLEIYTFNALKLVSKNKFLRYGLLLLSIGVYINFFITVYTYDRSNGQTPQFQMAMGLLLTFLIPKLFVVIVLFGEDIYRWIVKGISSISNSETQPLAGRRKFISQLALGLATIPFVSFIYGIIQGKYNYKVIKHQLAFDDLPASFDGYTITQISDIHSGSFTNKEKIQYGVDLINEQKSDLMLFIGDIVNNKADEMDDWIDVFSKLEAKGGEVCSSWK